MACYKTFIVYLCNQCNFQHIINIIIKKSFFYYFMQQKMKQTYDVRSYVIVSGWSQVHETANQHIACRMPSSYFFHVSQFSLATSLKHVSCCCCLRLCQFTSLRNDRCAKTIQIKRSTPHAVNGAYSLHTISSYDVRGCPMAPTWFTWSPVG